MGVVAEVVDRSLLSLVKEFDAILSVYEGFCNLKQVPASILFHRFICDVLMCLFTALSIMCLVYFFLF